MAEVGVSRTLELQPRPESVSAARRLVRDVLTECGHLEWLDAAELAVSEVVTNGALHAHTLLEVMARCESDCLLVEVRDTNTALPTQRQYGTNATTGRGMALVAAITQSHGITPLGQHGKIVWFTVSDEPLSTEDLLDAWGEDLEPVAAPRGARRVTLPGLPPTLWLAAVQHHDTLLRELALFRGGRAQSVEDLAIADRARATIRLALEREVAAARITGDARSPLPDNHPATLDAVPPEVDLVVEVDEDSAADFAVLQDVLDEAERLAAADQLLARPGLPEIVAVRDWAAEQVIAQLSGLDPVPWQGAAAEWFAQMLDEEVRRLDWDPSPVRDADRGAVAADEANRIVAISRPLADELGWDPDDLVGRRVVAIVPPHFREAHVSGFTRHLSTGVAHALEVELQLPVLRADATEVLCNFFIEAQRSRSGRTVYVAWVTPVD